MTEAAFVEHTECSSCGSSDGNAVYDDGHTYCFVCETYTASGEEPKQAKGKRMSADLESPGEYIWLTKRSISEDVCRKFRYSVKEGMQIAPYYDNDGNLVAQKIRRKGKEFSVAGDMKQAQLFGQNLFRHGGKRLIITEGEIDAMSVYMMNGGWPVVSIQNGAQAAVKSVSRQIEFVESYDEVVICFDNDEPGREAAVKVAELLTPGKAKIATLPRKDANEMLNAGEAKAFMSAIFEARPHRPDGIINMADTWDLVSQDVAMGHPYPWKGLTEMTFGLREGEIVTLTAGSGVGKSAVSAEVAYGLLMDGKTVGYVALEEGVRRTGQRFMGLYLDVPIHLPGRDVDENLKRNAFNATLGTGRLFTYDHFGSLEGDNLLSRLRFLVKGCGCRWIVLDHLSIVVSGMEDNDERKAIDVLMTKLRSFVEETGCGMILVSHLKRPEGRGHEEGARVTLAQLRGSASIAQLSDMVIGVERDQQSEDEDERNTTTIRVLKNRYSGTTGVCAELTFSHETGRLTETSAADHGF